jgi:hypothetical protein
MFRPGLNSISFLKSSSFKGKPVWTLILVIMVNNPKSCVMWNG